MQLIINGEETTFEDISTLAELFEKINPAGHRVAVLLNDTVMKVEVRGAHILQEGDRINLLTFVGGG